MENATLYAPDETQITVPNGNQISDFGQRADAYAPGEAITLTPACFTGGSKIDTQTGAISIADLSIGDMVRTQDHGWQPIRRIGSTLISEATLQSNPEIRPVLVRRHAFGPNVPNRDMRLSPEHRVLIAGYRAELFFGEPEILVPICKLRNDRHIMTDHLVATVRYFYILLDMHSVIFVDGAPCESFFWDGKPMNSTATGHAPGAPSGDQFCARAAGHAPARPCFSDKRVELL